MVKVDIQLRFVYVRWLLVDYVFDAVGWCLMMIVVVYDKKTPVFCVFRERFSNFLTVMSAGNILAVSILS